MTSQKNHEGVGEASEKNGLGDIPGIKLWMAAQPSPSTAATFNEMDAEASSAWRVTTSDTP
jgi:hypothetical protein